MKIRRALNFARRDVTEIEVPFYIGRVSSPRASRPERFDSPRKFLPELLHFGRNYERAVRLVWMVLKIFLMVRFGRIKLLRRLDRGNHRIFENLLGCELADRILGCGL